MDLDILVIKQAALAARKRYSICSFGFRDFWWAMWVFLVVKGEENCWKVHEESVGLSFVRLGQYEQKMAHVLCQLDGLWTEESHGLNDFPQICNGHYTWLFWYRETVMKSFSWVMSRSTMCWTLSGCCWEWSPKMINDFNGFQNSFDPTLIAAVSRKTKVDVHGQEGVHDNDPGRLKFQQVASVHSWNFFASSFRSLMSARSTLWAIIYGQGSFEGKWARPRGIGLADGWCGGIKLCWSAIVGEGLVKV